MIIKNENFEVRQKEIGKGIFATKTIRKGELILEFEKNYVKKPTNKSLRITEKKHQLSKDVNSPENFVNHSCVPNAFIDFKDLSLHSLKKIKKNEEIQYNYLTVDWDDEDVFICKCGSKNCFRKIEGFKSLTMDKKKKLKKYLSPFLLSKLNQELKKKE